MWTRRLTVVCLLASLLSPCWSQRAEQLLAQNPCSSKMTCRECIRTPTCAWCFADNYSGARCLNPKQEVDINASCGEAFLWNPISLYSKVVDNELSRGRQAGYYEEHSSSFGSQGAFAEAGGSYAGGGGGGAAAASGENLVQIRPQQVKLELRLHEKKEIKFAYSQAKDYPVDLYYLMDLSRSMKNDKEKLSALGSLLSSTMKNITSNFSIGFGSFVDKLVMPYVSTVPKNLESPCEGCAAPYGFRNQMSLSRDTDGFERAVAAASVSGNLDAPEGGFDAIMQAVVCKDKIGWRPQSRKLLVFSTDAGFHYAGDGKLGGIVQPNDGECHMENDVYTHSTKQDYPSISQINLKVKKNAINVIFAVTAEQIDVYNRLSQHIEGSTTGVLSDDSGNVVELVRDQYNKITSTVEMRDSASKEVQVTYFSACLDGNYRQTNKCDGLKVGDVVEFTAEITLKECPEDSRNWHQTFEISPVGVPETMTVELEMLCDCKCEHPGNPGYNAGPGVCNNRGISACGVCVCDERYFGKNCECSAQEGGSIEQERGCRPANASSGVLCSGRGTCICGICQCHKLDDPTKEISGPYCECDNYGCNRYHDLICAGPERGECVCGTCHCREGFTGPDCACPLDQGPCRSPENGEICSGHGKCQCGQCVCNMDDEKHYSGKYCEKCPTCPGKCALFKDCVLCEVHERGPMLNETQLHNLRCGDCSLHPHIEPGKIEANESRNEHLCSFYDDEDCLFVFVYSYDENQQLVIRAQKERECPKKVPILGIILGVIAAIVLVGLALLMLWKMVTTIHDRREFARFEKERMSAKWDTGENPIYKQATSTFKNPTYAGK